MTGPTALTARDHLRAALLPLVGQPVAGSLGAAPHAAPVITITGILEGAIELSAEPDPPIAVVIDGQHLTLWPDQLAGLRLDVDVETGWLHIQLPDGLAITLSH
jgi:hypothetical protein